MASVHLNHIQIVTEFAQSLFRAAITVWHLTYEYILRICLHSNVSSENLNVHHFDGFLHSSSYGL